MRAPHWGWLLLTIGIIVGAVTVALVALLFAAPFRADAKIWKSIALDSAKCSDRSGRLFNPRVAEQNIPKTLGVPDTGARRHGR